MEVRLKPDQENTMGPALGVIAGPFHLFPATFPAFPFPFRGYCRKGATTASNSPAGMAPTLR